MRNALSLDQILDEERDAVQRAQRVVAQDGRFRRTGGGPRLILWQTVIKALKRLRTFDARQRGFDQFHR